MRTTIAAVAIVFMGLSIAGCSAKRPIVDQEVTGLDKKYSTFAWGEQGKIAEFYVGTRATRDRGEDPYFPLEIAVVNRGLKQLLVTRESFVLIDEDGNRYQAAGPKELLDYYNFLDWDRQLAELGAILDTRFSSYTRYPSKFSPTRDVRTSGSELIRDFTSLPKFGYLIDFIYFPQPKTGLRDHEFELFLQSRDLADPIFVKFRVE
jgi:hypothetical protein